MENKEKFWQEKPEPLRVLLPHDNGPIENIFSDRYDVWRAKKIRPAGDKEVMFILEKRDEV